MLSIDIKKLLSAVLLCILSYAAVGKVKPPTVLLEPVFGLKMPMASIMLEPLSEGIRAQCIQLADNENWKGRLWIYARAESELGTYFVVGGIYERANPKFSGPRFHVDSTGAVFKIKDGRCTTFGPAREVFEARYFVEVPQLTLQHLADNLISNLSDAFKGKQRLMDALRRQKVDHDNLPLELQVSLREVSR
jgi:hypothetical protein